MRALLMGREPGAELGYRYVSEPPYDAVVIGSLSLGQLLSFREERVLEALALGMKTLDLIIGIGIAAFVITVILMILEAAGVFYLFGK